MKKFNLLTSYPQNYIIRNPIYGTLILFLFYVGFLWLYHPMNTQRSQLFNFEMTMALYSGMASISAYFTIRLLKRTKLFADENKWSIIKEFFSIYLVLQVMGIVTFFSAFLIEDTSWETRMNLHTFLDSCKYPFLIGIFPFGFFTLLNYKHLMDGTVLSFNQLQNPDQQDSGLLVDITSKLIRESLSFHSHELLFATSDGNYVEFHLFRDGQIEKVPIRNSISDIEAQFADIPYYFRCHRAFIVNLKMVEAKKGNTLGYRLSISNCTTEVPVSRQYVKAFDQLFA